MTEQVWRRRQVLQQGFAAAATCMVGSAAAKGASYPHRAIRLVVPFAPGGSSDIVARLLADALQTQLGQPVVVENKAGAAGMIGAQAVAQAAPDGYTLGLGSISTLAVNPVLLQGVTRVEPLRDLSMVGPVASIASVFAVHPSLQVHDFAQFLSAGRAAGDAWAVGSSGVGSIGHVILEALNAELGLSMRHIPYRGMGPAVQSALAGQTQVLSDQVPSSQPHVQAGRMRAVAVAAHARVRGLESIPTLAELGYPKLNRLAITWFGVVAPAHLPAAITQRLNAAIQHVLQDEALRERLAQMGVEPLPGSSEMLETMVRDTLAQVQQIAQQRGLLPEQP